MPKKSVRRSEQPPPESSPAPENLAYWIVLWVLVLAAAGVLAYIAVQVF